MKKKVILIYRIIKFIKLEFSLNFEENNEKGNGNGKLLETLQKIFINSKNSEKTINEEINNLNEDFFLIEEHEKLLHHKMFFLEKLSDLIKEEYINEKECDYTFFNNEITFKSQYNEKNDQFCLDLIEMSNIEKIKAFFDNYPLLKLRKIIRYIKELLNFIFFHPFSIINFR